MTLIFLGSRLQWQALHNAVCRHLIWITLHLRGTFRSAIFVRGRMGIYRQQLWVWHLAPPAREFVQGSCPRRLSELFLSLGTTSLSFFLSLSLFLSFFFSLPLGTTSLSLFLSLSLSLSLSLFLSLSLSRNDLSRNDLSLGTTSLSLSLSERPLSLSLSSVRLSVCLCLSRYFRSKFSPGVSQTQPVGLGLSRSMFSENDKMTSR